MNNNYEIKEVNIKNGTCYYFHDTLNINNLNLNNILFDEKSYEDILIYDVAYKTPYGSKSLGIIFDKIDEYIRIYDGTKHLAFPHSNEKFERIFDKISYYVKKQYFRSFS